MKKKEMIETRQKTKVELLKMLADKKKELRQLCLDASMMRLKNTASLKTFKKDIARIMTFVMEKEVV